MGRRAGISKGVGLVSLSPHVRRPIHLVGEREIQAADLTALARCNPGFDTYGFWTEPCGAVPAFCPSATPEVW